LTPLGYNLFSRPY